MNRFSVLALAATLAATGLSGCAGAPRQAWVQSESDPFDRTYMARVEHEAMRRGVRVLWVNPPRREVPDLAQSD